MKFEDILPQLRQGKIVKRKKLSAELHIIFKGSRILSKSVRESEMTKYSFYNLRYDDIEAEDWEIVNDF
jgi:hypothetical protein